jgi:hypothetical protein
MKNIEQNTTVEKSEIIEKALLESVGGGLSDIYIDLCSIFSIDVCGFSIP